ncbi:alginate lyase [Sphingomonas deserti]|uniref:Alginate lyase n=1 Tax=Allosphingosinicella deserti TaxID=2116704 RepID=A0A2P7QME8_9SPHN|nr:alginate lyase [Sphingomonas deserti]
MPGLSQPSTCRGVEGQSAAFGGRRTFLIDGEALTAIKAAREPAVREAIADLTVRADRALARKAGSVVDKTRLPPSGDRHDYTSLAPYWWPDPKTPNGPYVRRDGEVNPERSTDAFDREALGRMVSDADTLGLAYFYTGEPRYAGKAASIVRAWFLDPATRMNSNMDFAQAVPGRERGRPEGVLDSSGFMQVIDAVGLIAPSGALTAAETKRLEAWFSDYVDWMLTSRNGRGEQAAKNNHGLWYDAQLIQFALFARRADIAEKTILAFPQARIAAQFDPSGALPAELARTRSFHYSLYALNPAFDVAKLATCFGYDLWNYSDPEGRSLRKATDLVAGYRGARERWPHPERAWPEAELEALLTRADDAWGPGSYPRAAAGPTLLRTRPRPTRP